MTFPYFDSLSAKNKRIYLASDRVREIVLPESAHAGLAVKLRRLRGALGAASQRSTEGACREITRAICEALCVAIPTVRVHEVRPTGDYGELHGLYTRWEDGRARIEVWMRTAVNEQPVAFRTFLRTLAHEIGHHLDYVHLALADSFHTEGFFSRESSLVKQLLAAVPPARAPKRGERDLPPPDESSTEKLLRLRERLGVKPAVRSAESTIDPAIGPVIDPVIDPVIGPVTEPVVEPASARAPRRPRARASAREESQLSLLFVSDADPELRRP